jgi:hypothetical protein
MRVTMTPVRIRAEGKVAAPLDGPDLVGVPAPVRGEPDREPRPIAAEATPERAIGNAPERGRS